MANFFLDWLQGLGRRRRPTLLGMPGAGAGIYGGGVPAAPEGAERWLLGSPLRTRAIQERTRGVEAQAHIRRGLFEAEAGERRIAETPYYEFMPAGAAREAARARGEVGMPAGAARLRRGARKHRERVAALGGRELPPERPAGVISRFAITEKPQTEEMAARLAAYRERERKRRATARAGKRSVLRTPSRYKRRTVLG